jgi:DNA polymerase III subunit gamma/tau
MSLDTKYRPKIYSDVIGQDSIIKILKNILKTGARYHQSYLFSGPWGSGKTTLARILARALLCETPDEGQACDKCLSCKNMLSGNSPDFIEVDAATNSGKEDMKRVLEEIEYSTFSGNRKIYLFDEAHALTKGSLDSLLLPLENNIKGSQDKKLVCIFCTTEPEKMRATILSRCAPSFVVQPATIGDITNKLKNICISEGLSYEEDSLQYIAQHTDKHIRDALKTLESVILNRAITTEYVKSYLGLDLLDNYYSLILNIQSDIDSSLNTLENIIQKDSPDKIYSRLIDIFFYSYKLSLGVSKVPDYFDPSKLRDINNLYGKKLLMFAKYLSEKLYSPSKVTLSCDLYHLSGMSSGQPTNLVNPPIINILSGNSNKEGSLSGSTTKEVQKLAPNVPITTHSKVTTDGVYVNPRAINTNRNPIKGSQNSIQPEGAEMEPHDFKWLLKLKLTELGLNGNRKT